MTFAALLLTVVAGVTHYLWGLQAEHLLQKRIDALHAAGEPVLAGDFAHEIPDDENAAIPLTAAAKAIDSESAEWKAIEALIDSAPKPSAEQLATGEAAVARFQKSIDLAMAARRRPGSSWYLRAETSTVLTAPRQHLNEQRNLALLLQAAALCAHARGDDAAALDYVRSILSAAPRVDDPPTVVPHLVSCGLEHVAAVTLGWIAPDLRMASAASSPMPPSNAAVSNAPAAKPASREQARTLIDELLDDKNRVVRRQRAIQGERMGYIDAGRRIADGSATAEFTQPGSGRAAGVVQSVWTYLNRPMALTDARLMAENASAFLQPATAPDFPTFKAAAPTREAVYDQLTPPFLHVLARCLQCDFGAVVDHDYRALAARRLAAAAVACRLYALDHDGQLPPTLDALVPTYLSTVPMDPMAAGKPLRYKSADPRPMVYSVGPDGGDDGGTERNPENRRAPYDEVFHLRQQPQAIPKPAAD